MVDSLIISVGAILISVAISHLIGDFILQPRWMGEGKSSSFITLLIHIFVYSSAVWVSLPLLISTSQSLFIDIQIGDFISEWNSYKTFWYLFIGHFAVDVWTSKLTGLFYLKYLKTENKRWMDFFWWTIGLDQTLHTIHLMVWALYIFYLSWFSMI